MADTDEKVKQIVVEQLGVDEAEVTPNASFVDDLGADSLDTVELVMAFEEAFDIEIPDEDAEKIRTVKDAIDYIGKHAKGGKYRSLLRDGRRTDGSCRQPGPPARASPAPQPPLRGPAPPLTPVAHRGVRSIGRAAAGHRHGEVSWSGRRIASSP